MSVMLNPIQRVQSEKYEKLTLVMDMSQKKTLISALERDIKTYPKISHDELLMNQKKFLQEILDILRR